MSGVRCLEGSALDALAGVSIILGDLCLVAPSQEVNPRIRPTCQNNLIDRSPQVQWLAKIQRHKMQLAITNFLSGSSLAVVATVQRLHMDIKCIELSGSSAFGAVVGKGAKTSHAVVSNIPSRSHLASMLSSRDAVSIAFGSILLLYKSPESCQNLCSGTSLGDPSPNRVKVAVLWTCT